MGARSQHTPLRARARGRAGEQAESITTRYCEKLRDVGRAGASSSSSRSSSSSSSSSSRK
eukprot:2410639-Heterocapsa_arctica.AAC.1